jgi:hypothetical protein
MIRSILEHCGVFAAPQVLLSVVTLGLLAAYLLAWWRRELLPGENPWEQTLEPLAGIAVTIGLLGSVYGFIVAFGGFRQGLDVPKVVSGLGSAYWTTGVGIVTSLVASLGSYVLSALNR